MANPDSPDKWLQLRLVYRDDLSIENAVRGRIDVDRETLGLATRMDKKLGLWNIEWAIKEKQSGKAKSGSHEFLALRTRPIPSKWENVKDELTVFAESLMKRGLIKDYVFDLRTWLQSRESPDYLESWNEWYSLLRILNHLSKVIAEIMNLKTYSRTEYFFHEKVIHHLHNMMHIQDSFRPMKLESKVQGYSRALLLTCPRILLKDGIHSWPHSEVNVSLGKRVE